MNYTEFVHAVETMINQRKEGGLKATVYTAVKNNDTRRTGVILETPGINLSPTIYLEEFYESYLGGKTINEIVDELLETYEKIKKECFILYNFICYIIIYIIFNIREV